MLTNIKKRIKVKKLKYIGFSLAIVLTLGFSGCSTSGRIGPLPSIADENSSSQLVLIRVSSIVGAANSYYVALDGKDIFSIRSGENTEFPIPAGKHYVSVKCFGGWTPTWKEAAKRFNALPNQTSYFKISPNLSCAEIVSIEPDEAKTEIQSTDFVSPSELSN